MLIEFSLKLSNIRNEYCISMVLLYEICFMCFPVKLMFNKNNLNFCDNNDLLNLTNKNTNLHINHCFIQKEKDFFFVQNGI